MDQKEINTIIDCALKEDKSKTDITTRILIPKNETCTAVIIAKETAIICGLSIIQKIFHKIDKKIFMCFLTKDGKKVLKNSKIIFLKGKARSILAGERVALNFLSHLSAIATQTNRFVKQVRPYKAKILDTRKTIPGLRSLQKYAVRCGGGVNHRLNLNDMLLIKDNHLASLQKKMSLQKIIGHARKVSKKPVEIEIDNLRDLKRALLAHPDMILLDNMTLRDMKKAVLISKSVAKNKRPLLEASGNVNIKNVRLIAKTGVDRISIGALTHTVKAIDISLEFLSKK